MTRRAGEVDNSGIRAQQWEQRLAHVHQGEVVDGHRDLSLLTERLRRILLGRINNLTFTSIVLVNISQKGQEDFSFEWVFKPSMVW